MKAVRTVLVLAIAFSFLPYVHAAERTAMDVFRSGKVDDAIRSLKVQVSTNPSDARA